MTNKSSINIQPCNVRQSEAHNWRKKEYMRNIKKEHITIRTDLTPQNESFVSSEIYSMGLPKYLEMLAALVKEKTGRAMQMKVRERVSKKTGRVSKVNGCSALKEGVIICKENTTMRDLMRFCLRCQKRWGITAIQIHIHRDEGSWANDGPRQWKSNLHAHIVWDWIDHSTGKTFKLNQKDMSEMQDFAAETLGMERGTRKEETGLEHLSRNDYILAKQKKELEELQKKLAQQKKETEKQKEELKTQNKELEKLAEKKKSTAQEVTNLDQQKEDATAELGRLEEEKKAVLQEVSALNKQREVAEKDLEMITELEQKIKKQKEIIATQEKTIASNDHNINLAQSKARIETGEELTNVCEVIPYINKVMQWLMTCLQKALEGIVRLCSRPDARRFNEEEAQAIASILQNGKTKEERGEIRDNLWLYAEQYGKRAGSGWNQFWENTAWRELCSLSNNVENYITQEEQSRGLHR